jgi:hypothetical protein
VWREKRVLVEWSGNNVECRTARHHDGFGGPPACCGGLRLLRVAREFKLQAAVVDVRVQAHAVASRGCS